MAKFSGNIGFIKFEETAPSVWSEVATEKHYTGDIIQASKQTENSGNVNDNININNRISIVGDAYANENIFAIKYVEWMGSRWKVKSIDVQRPRLILSIGGLWNGKTPGTR